MCLSDSSTLHLPRSGARTSNHHVRLPKPLLPTHTIIVLTRAVMVLLPPSSYLNLRWHATNAMSGVALHTSPPGSLPVRQPFLQRERRKWEVPMLTLPAPRGAGLS